MYPSGQWRGYWEQPGYGRQFMNDFTLRFADGQIKGSGQDMVGLFVIEGEYDQGHIHFVKQYLGRHHVIYSGQYDGEGVIHGTYLVEESGYTGPFALSPVPPKISPDAPIQEIRPCG